MYVLTLWLQHAAGSSGAPRQAAAAGAHRAVGFARGRGARPTLPAAAGCTRIVHTTSSTAFLR